MTKIRSIYWPNTKGIKWKKSKSKIDESFYRLSLIAKSVEISEQNFSSYLQFTNRLDFFCFPSFSFLNDPFKFFSVVTNIRRLQEWKPFMVPLGISNDLVHCRFLYLHTWLSR